MDQFDDIAALAEDVSIPVSIKDAAEAYERESVKRLLRLWKRFAVNLPSPHKEAEIAAPFQSDLQLSWVKAYMAWRAKTGQGRFGERITVTTLLKELQQLQRVLRLANNVVWDNKDIAIIKKFVRDLAKIGRASTAMRPKSVAYALDADEIQYYLWNCCERVYAHPRMMVQFSFWLHLVSVWGLRTGEMTESSSHRGSNEGIHYGDVTLSLVPRQSQLRYQIKIALRNRKFSRGIESKVKIVTLNEHTDPKERFKCPIRKFLALALADDVFVQQLTPEDFDNRWMSDSAGSRSFSIKEDRKELPIFRKMLPGGAVSPTQIISAMSINTFLKEICEECGYTEPVTTYTFRRGVANKVEANASSKSTKEALGHKGERAWHAYAAPTISVDAQAIAYDEPQDTSHAEHTQSIAMTRDFAGPKPPRATMGILSIPSKSVLQKVVAAHPKSRPEMIVRKARRLQYQLELAEYSDKAGRSTSPRESDFSGIADLTESLNTAMIVNPRPKPTAKFKQMLKYNQHHGRVIERLWTAEDASLSECIRPLMALADPRPFRPFYPGPTLRLNTDGQCPYCHDKVDQLRHPRLASHLLHCHSRTKQVRFCHQCAFFVAPELWASHECTDLDEDNQEYGAIIWHGLIIREGRCPYGDKGCHKRLWSDPNNLCRHIETHLKGLPEESLACPVEGCEVQRVSKDQVRIHFHEVHHIHMVSGRDILTGGIVLPQQIEK